MLTVAPNLCRRYGTRLPSVPAALEREPAESTDDASAAQDQSHTSVLGRSPVGGSPPDLQIRGGGRFVRLYPEGADPSQPWEPGTPSNENVLATQQVWDSLQRGQHTAYRVSTHLVTVYAFLGIRAPVLRSAAHNCLGLCSFAGSWQVSAIAPMKSAVEGSLRLDRSYANACSSERRRSSQWRAVRREAVSAMTKRRAAASGTATSPAALCFLSSAMSRNTWRNRILASL